MYCSPCSYSTVLHFIIHMIFLFFILIIYACIYITIRTSVWQNYTLCNAQCFAVVQLFVLFQHKLHGHKVVRKDYSKTVSNNRSSHNHQKELTYDNEVLRVYCPILISLALSFEGQDFCHPHKI